MKENDGSKEFNNGNEEFAKNFERFDAKNFERLDAKLRGVFKKVKYFDTKLSKLQDFLKRVRLKCFAVKVKRLAARLSELKNLKKMRFRCFAA